MTPFLFTNEALVDNSYNVVLFIVFSSMFFIISSLDYHTIVGYTIFPYMCGLIAHMGGTDINRC